MKFLAVAALPVAFAAVSPRAGAPAIPDAEGLTKAIEATNAVAATCLKAVNAFSTSGVTDTTSLETSCVPLDAEFSKIDLIIQQTVNVNDKTSTDALAPIKPAFTSLLKTLGQIEAAAAAAPGTTFRPAVCKLASSHKLLGVVTVQALQKLALASASSQSDNSKAADDFAKKLDAVIKQAGSCGSATATSSGATTTPTSSGIVLPPPVSRTSEGAAGATGGAGGASSKPTGIVTAGAAGVAPQVMVAVAAAAGALYML